MPPPEIRKGAEPPFKRAMEHTLNSHGTEPDLGRP
jgi:hypothetical protein